MARRRRRLRCVMVLAGVLVALAQWGPAWAHGELIRSDPPPDAVLAKAPDTLRLWFNEPVEPTFSEAVVYDDGGTRADRGDSRVSSADPSLLEVSLARLPVGTLTVEWRVLTKLDGHLTSGSFQFNVGGLGRAPGASAAAPSGTFTPTTLSVASKWLGIVAGFLAAGGMTFWLLVYRPALAEVGNGDARSPGLRERPPLVLAIVALGSLLASLVLDALAQGWGAGALHTEAGWAEALRTGPGRAWAARMVVLLATALLVFVGAVAHRRRRTVGERAPAGDAGELLGRREGWGPWWATAVAMLGAVVLLSYSTLSHLSASSGIAGATLDFVHLASASVWLGGLAGLLGGGISSVTSAGHGGQGRFLRRMVRRFSSLALASVAVVLVTGVVAALIQFDRPSDLVSTGYGRALLAKLALVAPLLLLGFLQLTTVSHQLLPAAWLRKARSLPSRLVALGRPELALAGMVLAAAVTMSLLPPATSGAPSGIAAPDDPPGPLRLSRSVDGLEATLDLDPRKVVSDRLVLSLVDARGQPVDGATVTSHTYSLDEDSGETTGQATGLGEGRYASGGLPDRPGRWMVEFDVAPQGMPAVMIQFELNFSPERSDVFLMPLPGPSDPGAARLLAQAVERMRGLRSLRFDQVTDDGTGQNPVSAFAIVERPDSLYLRIEDGTESIRIGSTWFFRLGDGQWSREEGRPNLGGPAGFWRWLDRPAEVQFAGTGLWDGRPVQIVSLMLPSLPAKYWEWIDEDTGLIVREVMVAKGHYMTTKLYGFDLPPEVKPPPREQGE